MLIASECLPHCMLMASLIACGPLPGECMLIASECLPHCMLMASLIACGPLPGECVAQGQPRRLIASDFHAECD
jgi:hypothetical protein